MMQPSGNRGFASASFTLNQDWRQSVLHPLVRAEDFFQLILKRRQRFSKKEFVFRTVAASMLIQSGGLSGPPRAPDHEWYLSRVKRLDQIIKGAQPHGFN